ncbi:hypothetical protein [Pyrodictium abyssi]|uniref:ArsR family transcriptional regulator n=1 Tax=Pyrodictium abyssi TaxID=54256 RepID=A0ABM8IUQ0_9CREN|nr:hypothetical protein PABY_08310 [Pyrodictium abyssi]
MEAEPLLVLVPTPSDQELIKAITGILQRRCMTRRELHRELRRMGMPVGEKRLRKLVFELIVEGVLRETEEGVCAW